MAPVEVFGKTVDILDQGLRLDQSLFVNGLTVNVAELEQPVFDA
jgi:hypothetical protein